MGWVETIALKLLIPVLTPVILMYVKRLVPIVLGKVPKHMVPTLAPVVGATLEQVLLLAGAGVEIPGLPAGVSGAVSGALGVWIREVVDQWKRYVQGGAVPAS